jgi:threonyl-tRNA synthetase
VIPITDSQNDYAKSIFDKLYASGFRVKLDERNEKIGYKIRDWETKKVPYMVILGEKEKQNGNISVRVHKKGDLGSFETDRFIGKISDERNNKTINQ